VGALLALAPSLLGAAAAACVPWIRSHASEAIGAALWGLVVLASFAGWGGAVAAFVLPGRRVDWGLRAAIGMAGVVALGGVLQLPHLLSPAMVVAVVMGGLAAQAVTRFRRRDQLSGELWQVWASARATPASTIAIAALYAAALYAYVGSFTTPIGNIWDDYEAYFVYPKAMLAYGGLDEPFSFRRLAALGGQSYLHALLLTASTIWRLNGLDNGICLLVLVGLVHGYARGRRVALFVTLLFVVGFTYHLHNTASELSGAVLFLALFRVFDSESAEALCGWRCAILIGLLGAATCTLRQNYLVPVIAIVGLSYGFALRGRWREGKLGLVAGPLRALAALALFLLPWWIVIYRSSGTFLFPVIPGNGRADFGLRTTISFAEEIDFLVFNAQWNRPVLSVFIFVLAALCFDEGRDGKPALRPFLLGAGVGVLALIHALKSSDDVSSVSRYYTAFELALVIAVALKCLARLSGGWRSAGVRGLVAAALVVLAVGFQIWGTREETAAQLRGWSKGFAEQARTPLSPEPDSKDAFYQKLQRAIPEGAPFLEMLDEPFRLDFGRNRVITCDQPGGAGPAPGIPTGHGVDAYERYFLAHSIRYLAFSLAYESPEYNRGRWAKLIGRTFTAKRNGRTRGAQLFQMAPIYVDFFDALAALAKRHKPLFVSRSVYVVDLADGARG
jgi:hypothetical protein